MLIRLVPKSKKQIRPELKGVQAEQLLNWEIGDSFCCPIGQGKQGQPDRQKLLLMLIFFHTSHWVAKTASFLFLRGLNLCPCFEWWFTRGALSLRPTVTTQRPQPLLPLQCRHIRTVRLWVPPKRYCTSLTGKLGFIYIEMKSYGAQKLLQAWAKETYTRGLGELSEMWRIFSENGKWVCTPEQTRTHITPLLLYCFPFPQHLELSHSCKRESYKRLEGLRYPYPLLLGLSFYPAFLSGLLTYS